jgi:hypothetical protein
MSLKDRMLGLTVSREDSDTLSLEQIQVFLEASGQVGFQAQDRTELYQWIEFILRHHNYPKLPRADKGLLRRYVAKMTGLSRAQSTRLIQRYEQNREV